MDSDRYDFLNDRCDHIDGRVDDLDTRLTSIESDKEVKKSRTLEWVVIVLIVVEVIQGFVAFFHHG